MSRAVLILRPQPGAARTAERARALGLRPVEAPLFTVRAVAWEPPGDDFEAVMLTSANAVRHAGDALASLRRLPCYAVGPATAEAAREVGFADVRTGPADAAALLERMAADGIRGALHLAGRDRLDLRQADVRVRAVTVYAADALDQLPGEAEAAIARGALVLVHSPRAAALLAKLAGDRRGGIRIAAISAAAAEAASTGWADVSVAERPRDEALLELAAKLCQNGAG